MSAWSFAVDDLGLVVRVIVGEVGAGEDERIAVRFYSDQLCQRDAKRAAAGVTLIAHDDGNELEVADHFLQPG